MDPALSEEELPRKRQRLANGSGLDGTNESATFEPELEVMPKDPNGMEVDNDAQMLSNGQGPSDVGVNTVDDVAKESAAGITEFVNPDAPGFSGILKKRYTDFLVNEILPSGEVLHLGSPSTSSIKNAKDEKQAESVPQAQTEQNSSSALDDTVDAPILPDLDHKQTDPEDNLSNEDPPEATNPKTPGAPAAGPLSSEISPEDKAELDSHLGPVVLQSILDLYASILRTPDAKARSLGTVTSQIIDDRSQRTTIHQLIRRTFSSRLDTSTDDDGAIVFSASSSAGRAGQNVSQYGRKQLHTKGKVGWQELGGEHLHFTIHKENKDTMEVVSFLARDMKLNPKSFNFAGTKDRRAVTVQRASAYRLTKGKMIATSKKLRGSALGGYEYRPHRLELGDLTGNEFLITLRDCQFSNDTNRTSQRAVFDTVMGRLTGLSQNGFLNYYGLQRFGTFATRTDIIGVKMLQSDFKAACDIILHYAPAALEAAQDASSSTPKVLVSSDDKARAQAINMFEKSGKGHPALNQLPRKFSAEAALIRHLSGQNRKRDYQGALQSVPRNLRTMYVHAYQSLVWNMAAGRRWKLFGNQVVEGDLVLVREHKHKDSEAAVPDTVDDSGEAVVRPEAGDSSIPQDDMFERARALSKEEAESGKYTIFDIVLPTPGFDILYPSNALAEFYKTFMASEQGGGLDPHDMRRAWRDISLSGSYRKFLSRPVSGSPIQCKVFRYEQDDEQMVGTDLDKMQNKSNMFDDLRGDGSDGKEAENFAANPDGSKIAVILKIQLGTGQYATMALRELMGPRGLHAWKPDFGGGR
ncbi:MAG: hypothetical protein M1837_006968 [Sclerophora amabilis]|nr:MAG: hypothetical protein M1837_006968 [Sclerophora amabilis]